MDDTKHKQFLEFCDSYRFNVDDRREIASEIIKQSHKHTELAERRPLQLIHIATFNQYRKRFLERVVNEIWRYEYLDNIDLEDLYAKQSDEQWLAEVEKAVEQVLRR